ncbi:hypothetical protein ACRRTK_020788 [Alexandromys fortis]
MAGSLQVASFRLLCLLQPPLPTDLCLQTLEDTSKILEGRDGREGDSPVASGFPEHDDICCSNCLVTVPSLAGNRLNGGSSVEHSSVSPSTVAGTGLQSPARITHSLFIVSQSSFPAFSILTFCNQILELVSPKWNAVLVFLTIFSTTAPVPLLAILEPQHHRSGSFLGDPV